MPTIHSLKGARIRMYRRDHSPPHFHLIWPDGEALVEIPSLAVLRGRPPQAVLRQALAWARQNLPLLEAAWNELGPEEP